MLFQARRAVFQKRLNVYLQAHADTLLFVFVITLGIASVLVSYYSLHAAIYSPFNTPTTSSVVTVATEATKDTDGDGLSDADELTIYGTSPYLKDTDGDGIPDGEEVARGTDANCPEGKTCATSSAAVDTTTPPPLATAPTASTSTPPAGVPQSAADLRQALKNAGVPDAILNTMTDDQLIAEYQQTVKNIASGNGASATPTTNTVPPSLQNLTPDQIRTLLRQNGVSDDKLNQLTDAQLEAIYQQTVQQIQNSQSSTSATNHTTTTTTTP